VSELPLTRSPAPQGSNLVLVVGNLTIDDVVLPTGATKMATLGGNSVHAATAVVTAGASAAVIARRGEDFPPAAAAALAEAGVDVSGLVDIAGPTVRNWVIYEEDGSRHWLYRTPPERSAQVAAQPEDLPESALRQAAVVHIAAMPLEHAERLVARVRQVTPDALITLDTHETWEASVADRVVELARTVGLFVPSLQELTQLVGAETGANLGWQPRFCVVRAGGEGRKRRSVPAGGRQDHARSCARCSGRRCHRSRRRILRRPRGGTRARPAGQGGSRARRRRCGHCDNWKRQPPAA
jgi:ribokinase